ncbi:MAG: recombinase family protein, partial [Oscillospiraceae bacterium]|nr:recombinase family protein [Oscillospiraceae bacterium]
MKSQEGFPGTVHGYCRCSTSEDRQDVNRQARELKQHGADVIWTEYEHGDADVKAQQQMMFQAAQPGDTIIVLEVSRLARSTKQLCDIIDLVKEKKLYCFLMVLGYSRMRYIEFVTDMS